MWIPENMKKIGGYPHNGYSTDMGMNRDVKNIRTRRYPQIKSVEWVGNKYLKWIPATRGYGYF